MEEKITVSAVRKKSPSSLSPMLGGLGFSRISYTKDRLVVERIIGEDLKGKPNLDYRIVFLEDSIELVYEVPPKASKRARLLGLLPVFLDVLVLSSEFYDVSAPSIFPHVQSLLSDIQKVIGKDVVELSAELEDMRSKFDTLNSRYKDLVSSSEENARILLESERRRDELGALVGKLKAMSDDRLREELYLWLKMRNGNIDIYEFGKAHDVPSPRVEEGLDMLIKEGYIKRRLE